MTTYAYDTSTHQLVAVWHTGIGATAQLVARLNAATQESVGLHVAQALTRMSEAVWLSYTRPEIVDLPVSAAVQAMRRPHLPEAGLVRVEMHPVVESAHRIGRELREVGSAGVTRAVIADVEEEMAAARNAERGDLTARARQAVMLTRVAPSPRAHPLRRRGPAGGRSTGTGADDRADGGDRVRLGGELASKRTQCGPSPVHWSTSVSSTAS